MISPSRAGSSHSWSWKIFSSAHCLFSFSSKNSFQLEKLKIAIFCHSVFFLMYFPCFYRRLGTLHIFKKQYIKNFNSKIEMPQLENWDISARLGSAQNLYSSARNYLSVHVAILPSHLDLGKQLSFNKMFLIK